MSDGRAARLRELTGALNGVSFDPAGLADRLLSLVEGHALGLTGDPDRDITRVTAARETTGEAGCAFELEGFAEDGTRRLWGAFDVSDVGTIEILIAVSKGNQPASIETFGQHGPLLGNRLLVAVLFDLTLTAAAQSGVSRVINHPVDDRVRSIYAAMGFEQGEVLDLAAPESLRWAVHFLDVAFEEGAQRFPGFQRPW